jgi:predicted metalloprotease
VIGVREGLRRHVVAVLATVAVVATLSACGASTGTKLATQTTTTSTRGTTTTGGNPGPSTDGSEIDRLPTFPGPTKPPTTPDLSTPAGQATFLQQVFADIQTVWQQEFTASGLSYTPARLVLFQSRVTTACGTESADVGPFYCSGDSTVYLDTRFFQSLATQFGVTGDFAEAYVVAHEVGHHIQNLVGITSRVGAADQADPSGSNSLSVKVELQADCFAGVWAHSTYERKLLEPGDIEDALKAAQAVGDDFLAHASGSAVDPDSWTHGSSAQRTHWFTTGYEDGTADACDTFAAQ